MQIQQLLIIVCYGLELVSAFYLPGAAPISHKAGDLLQIRAEQLVSARSQIPYAFYHLPYCRPQEIKVLDENLGEILVGNVHENTPFEISMLADEQCKVLCELDLKSEDIQAFRKAIVDEYIVNFSVDGLPVAMVLNSSADTTAETGEHIHEHIPIYNSVGVPVGVVDAAGRELLVNHWAFTIKYHQPDTQKADSTYEIVGFEVSPRSYDHVADSATETARSCSSTHPFVLKPPVGPKDSLKLKFSYSVQFEPSSLRWATRWDPYTRETAAATNIHWFSIINACLIVILLSGLIGIILLRTLLRDITQYNQMETGGMEDSGWKLIHGDVFRRPPHSKLLAVCAGTGVQILGMCLVTLVGSLLGLFSPAHRGWLLQAALFLFIFMGFPAGYVSAKFNQLFEMGDAHRNLAVTAMTALQFPGVCFAIFFIINVALLSAGSSGAVHFGTMTLLLLLWFGISVPLVFLGSQWGYRQKGLSVPVRTNQIPRQIPPSHWLLHSILGPLLTGVLPFCAVYTELLFILTSVWQHKFYYLFGFVTLVGLILVVTCAAVSITFTYSLLCTENYKWWWRSFWASGASALYVFMFCIFYFFAKLQITRVSSIVLYFGYSALLSYAFCLFTGATGFIATFFFLRAIYGAVRVD